MKFNNTKLGDIIEETHNGKAIGIGMIAKKCRVCVECSTTRGCVCISSLSYSKDKYRPSFKGGECVDENGNKMWIVIEDEDYPRFRIAKNQNPYLGE